MTVWVLGTGSREFTDPSLIYEVLCEVCVGLETPASVVTVVHGGNGTLDGDGRVVKGFDLLFGEVAAGMGMSVERVDAVWGECVPGCPLGHLRRNRRGDWYCPTAGHRRNQVMVDTHRYVVVLGFPLGRSSGTRDCMRRAVGAALWVVNCTEEWLTPHPVLCSVGLK